MSADHDAIRGVIDTWLAATRAGDIDAVLELMAPDAIFLIAGRPTIQGRDAFAQNLRAVLADHAIESTGDIDEIEVSGDMAYCRTRLTVTMISKHSSTPMPHNSHTLSILRRGADGRWRLTRDANMLDDPG